MGGKATGKTTRDWPGPKRDWLAFDRVDYLGTQIILGIAVAGSVLFGLVGPVVDAVNDAPLMISFTTGVTNGIDLPRGATHDGYATTQLLLGDATTGERLGQALPGLLISGLTIAVAWLLFQLLRSAQAGEPFRPGVVLCHDVEDLV
jgi:hypothetical protein